MKLNEGRQRLSAYSGNDLYQQAHQLYREEADSRISARSYGKPPTRNTIEGVVKEMNPWMEKVGHGLRWSDDEILGKLIERETGDTWVRYRIMDPRLEDFRKRARLNMLRGTPFPIAEALTNEALDAGASYILARMVNEAREVFQQMEGEEKKE